MPAGPPSPLSASPRVRVIPVAVAAAAAVEPAAVPPPSSSSLSESGSRDGLDDGRGAAHDSLPPPAETGADGKPRRKRSMIACKYCNERRVRCDGATIGLPCSNCRNAGRDADCRFIESRRIRGARGRFESRAGDSAPSSTSTTAASSRPAAVGPRRARRHSITGSTDEEEWRRLLQNSVSAHRQTPGPVTYLGESWPFSWVVQPASDGEESRPLHLPALRMEADEREFSVANRVSKALWDQGAYALPRPDVRDELVAEYFAVAHAAYPVVHKARFLAALRANSFSHLLLQSVLVVAATHCHERVLRRAGYVRRLDAAAAFYARARALFDGDVEPDKLTTIQSMFLLQFWWRAVADHKDTLWWLAGAIRMAQTMGLHRSTSRSRLSPEDRRFWKRVWWLLYMRDRQTASHLGKPIIIRDEDCDLEPLDIDDFDEDMTLVQRISVIEHVKLARLVGTIISSEFSPGTHKNLEERVRLREQCHAQLREWQTRLPPEIVYQSNSKNFYAMSLQMSFLAQLLQLNRPIVYKDAAFPAEVREGSERMATSASNAMTCISGAILSGWGARFMTQHCMSCLFAAMTVQIVNRRSPDPRKSADADAKLRTTLGFLDELSKILLLAGWIHKRFLRVLSVQDGRDEARERMIGSPTAVADVVETPPDAGVGLSPHHHHHQQVAPDQMAPDQMAPEQMAPDQMAPDQMAPDQMAPDQMEPDQMETIHEESSSGPGAAMHSHAHSHPIAHPWGVGMPGVPEYTAFASVDQELAVAMNVNVNHHHNHHNHHDHHQMARHPGVDISNQNPGYGHGHGHGHGHIIPSQPPPGGGHVLLSQPAEGMVSVSAPGGMVPSQGDAMVAAGADGQVVGGQVYTMADYHWVLNTAGELGSSWWAPPAADHHQSAYRYPKQ